MRGLSDTLEAKHKCQNPYGRHRQGSGRYGGMLETNAATSALPPNALISHISIGKSKISSGPADFHTLVKTSSQGAEDPKENHEIEPKITTEVSSSNLASSKVSTSEDSTEVRFVKLEHKIDNVSIVVGNKIDLMDVKIAERFRHFDRVMALMGSIFVGAFGVKWLFEAYNHPVSSSK